MMNPNRKSDDGAWRDVDCVLFCVFLYFSCILRQNEYKNAQKTKSEKRKFVTFVIVKINKM